MDIDIQRDSARSLRRNQTPAERKLWGFLRKRSLTGFRFHRQIEMGPYIVDFLCRERRLIIEVDGYGHGDAGDVSRDEKRSAYLQSIGYAVHRVDNVEVYRNIDGVLTGILRALEMRPKFYERKSGSGGNTPSPFGTSPSKAEGGQTQSPFPCFAGEGARRADGVTRR